MRSYYCLEDECCHLDGIDVIDLCEDTEEEEDPMKAVMAKASSFLMSLNQSRKKRFAPMKRVRREHTMDQVKTADKPGEVVQEGKAVSETDFKAETVINMVKEPQIEGAYKPPVGGPQPKHWTAPSTSQSSAGVTKRWRRRKKKRRIFFPDGSFCRIPVEYLNYS